MTDASSQKGWKLFLSPNGVIDRKTYWIGGGIILAISAVAFAVSKLAPGSAPARLAISVLGLAFFWPGICFYSKRLHDIGLSGWLQVLYYVVVIGLGVFIQVKLFPEIMAVAQANMGDQAAIQAATAELAQRPDIVAITYVAQAISIVWIVGLGLIPTKVGENKYDPNQDDDLDNFD